jgi:hypothetical protein
MEAQERPGMDTAETAFEDRELRLLLVEDSEAGRSVRWRA